MTGCGVFHNLERKDARVKLCRFKDAATFYPGILPENHSTHPARGFG
jgi:hypothetical protein